MRKPVLNTDPLVQHGLPIDLLNAAALTYVARHFMDKIIRPSACTANQGNLLQEPVLAFHPDAVGLLLFPEFAELHWKGWKVQRCPHYSLAQVLQFPSVSGLSFSMPGHADEFLFLIDLIGRNKNKTKPQVGAVIQQRAGSFTDHPF